MTESYFTNHGVVELLGRGPCRKHRLQVPRLPGYPPYPYVFFQCSVCPYNFCLPADMVHEMVTK